MERRRLHFENLTDAVSECERLRESGYVSRGRWSLGQICRHLRLTVDSSIDGYPKWMCVTWPVRPLLRWLLLPRLLRGDSPAGIKTAAIFQPPQQVCDRDEIAGFKDSVRRLQRHEGYLHPHPGIGKLDPVTLDRFHAAHAAHHLGFLSPRT